MFKIENAIVYLLSDIIYVFNLTFSSSFALEIVSFYGTINVRGKISENISILKEAFVVEKCFVTTERFLACFPYFYILIF